MTEPGRLRVAIATMTLARDEPESQLLRASLTALTRWGLPVVVTDGGSGLDFQAFLRSLPITLRSPRGPGLVNQVRTSIEACLELGADAILYTEPDKLGFFTGSGSLLVERITSAGEGGVIMAARSSKSFETFPPFQRTCEAAANRLCTELLGRHGDYFYGPFALFRDLVPWLEHIPEDSGWGWRPFIFAVAQRLGRPLVHVEGDFDCPVEQRTEEEGDRLHRLRQLEQNVRGLRLGITTSRPESAN